MGEVVVAQPHREEKIKKKKEKTAMAGSWAVHGLFGNKALGVVL